VPDVDVALSALGAVTDVKVIFSQKLMTLNNKMAMLQVGDQVPIITQTATGVRDATDLTVVNSVQLRDTGILLRVTPRIGKSGTVFVDVRQEVSNAITTETSSIDSPTIQQRKIESRLVVPSGQSVALGGLISTTQTNTANGIPLLMDIPLIGQLFRNDNQIIERTELIVLVTPRVLIDGAAAVDATDELRQAFRKLEERLAPPRP
jgi:general secretion pathway protein D